MAKKPVISIVMGSDSDLSTMKETVLVLKRFSLPYEVKILSAHRSPDKTAGFARTARERGIMVIIAAAGGAAHLAGVVAAHTTLPVIGVPMDSQLDGMDSLLSTVQMPSGIPVATVSIGKAGAVNAGILAAEILGVTSSSLARKLDEYKKELAKKVEEKNIKLMSSKKWKK